MDSQDQAARLIATIVVTSFISIVSVILRFWSKIFLKSGLHADDWWILATLVSFLGAQAASLWGVIAGTQGKEIAQIEAELAVMPSREKLLKLENFLEALFIGFTITLFTVYTAKISVCLLYRRIFSTESYRTLSTIVMGMATAWFVAAFITNFIICLPIDLFWHRLKPGKCLNFNLFYLLIGVFETIIDALILALPIRAVFGVKMSIKTKLVVSSIFLLGGFVVITNIIRLYYAYQPNAEFVSFTQSDLWTKIHITVAILCACLPVYKPVRAKLGYFLVEIRERLYSPIQSLWSGLTEPNPSRPSRSENDSSGHPMQRLASSDKSRYAENTYLPHDSDTALVPGPGGVANHISTVPVDGQLQALGIPKHGILHTRDVDVV